MTLVHIPELPGVSKEEGAAFRWDPVSKILTPLFADGSLAPKVLVPGSVAIQEVISASGSVNLTTAGVTVESQTLTLPAGWVSMDVLLWGHVRVVEAVTTRTLCDVWLESPAAAQLGQRAGSAGDDFGLATGRTVPLLGTLAGLTAGQSVLLKGQITAGADNEMQVDRRYVVAWKVRKT